MLFGMNRRKKETYEEPNYWISFSDFAISFLISFILLSSLILAYQYNQKLKTEEMANKLAASIVDIQETYAVRANIAKKLKEVFKDDLNVYVDEVSGTVTLKENVIEFFGDSAKLKSNPAFIDGFFVKYVKALREATSPNGKINYYNEDYIKRIIIEGHINKVNENTTGMELSQARALTVYNRIYPQIKNDYELKTKVQAVGRGYFAPYGNGKNPSANRRVEFHFTLNEEKIAKEQSQAIIEAEKNSKG
jgi:outer membrane protein OmpA-like peptidoglycan-associated protein